MKIKTNDGLELTGIPASIVQDLADAARLPSSSALASRQEVAGRIFNWYNLETRSGNDHDFLTDLQTAKLIEILEPE